MVSFAALVILLILLYVIARFSNLNRLQLSIWYILVFFSIITDSGYFIRIGSFDIKFSDALLLMLLLTSFLNYKQRKLGITTLTTGVLFCFSITIGILNLIINPLKETYAMPLTGAILYKQIEYSSEVFQRLLSTFFFVLALLFAGDLIRKNVRQTKKLIIYSTLLISLIGLFELAIKIGSGRPLVQEITATFFGVTSAQNLALFTRAGQYTLQGLMKEPYHYAYSFIPGLFLIALNNVSVSKKMCVLVSILSIFVLIFSLSFAGFGVIIAFLALTIIRLIKESKRTKGFFVVVIVVACLIISFPLLMLFLNELSIGQYYYSRAVSLLTGEQVGSEGVRQLTISNAFQIFLKRPLFGSGIGTNSAYGFLPSVLSNIGIISVILWLVFLVSATIPKTVRTSIVFLAFLLVVLTYIGNLSWAYSSMSVILLISIMKEEGI